MNVSVISEFTYTQEVLIDLKFKGIKIIEVPISVTYHEKRKSRVVKNIPLYTYRVLSIILKTLTYHRPILAFGIFGATLISLGIIGKIITLMDIFSISTGLSTGLIILGMVSFMMGLFARVVFKRQSFAEKDLRHYVKNLKEYKEE